MDFLAVRFVVDVEQHRDLLFSYISGPNPCCIQWLE